MELHARESEVCRGRLIRLPKAARAWTIAKDFWNRALRIAHSLNRWQCALILVALLLPIGWLLDNELYLLGRQKQFRSLTAGFREAGRQFGEPIGILFLALAVWVLDPVRRRPLVGMLVTALLAGGVASGLKLLVGRERPKVSGGETILHGPQWPLSDFDPGFPSGHTAAAVVLAFWLSQLYPRGRFVFIFFAAACGLSRVLGGAHFLTDVLAGAWVGWAIADSMWRTGWMRPDENGMQRA